MQPPPRWVRRLLLGPLVVLLGLALLATLPVTLAAAALVSVLLPGSRWRPLRALVVVVGYLVLEAVALVVLLAMWVACGFGWKVRSPFFERRHYVLVGTFLRVLFGLVRRTLRVSVESVGPDPSSFAGRPLVVFSRHAGPGDSFLIVYALVTWYDREPRIVLKDMLQWDPAIDVVLNRLPNRFVRPGSRRRGRQIERDVGELARNLDDDDALLLFPEGGNFTANRWRRAIQRLRRRGLLSQAAKAQAMRHVLAPKPGGVLAALDAAQEADVVWVAHTGTDHLMTVADVWRALPMDQVIRMRWWQVPPQDVPAGREERIDWLYGWWQRIDAWIAEHRVGPDPLAADRPS